MTLTSDYDYDLPRRLIAQFPLACRSDARLLVVDRRQGSLTHSHVRDLPEFLSPTDALVLNDSRVIPARLAGYRIQTAGRWEGLFLSVSNEGLWRVLGKTRGRLQENESIMLRDRYQRESISLTMVARLGGGEWVARPNSDEPAWTILDRVGRVPLPGYIRGGQMVDSDPANYQTVFARHPGSVAAPTAGLHFTSELLRRVEERGTATVRVTLHVGLGTFRPITAESLEGHAMHTEWASLDADASATLRQRRAAGGRIVAVGTTSVRTLESAAANGAVGAWQGETSLFIRPPFRFQAVDAMLTNFHLPRSTLLVLVRTFGGDNLIRAAYREAIREEYRFYSYGDAMLIV